MAATLRRVPQAADLDALVAPFVQAPQGAGVFTDFDGTLAPIVDDPAAAEALPGVPEVLDRLARRYARAGVVSGRPVSFLRQRLGDGLFLSGLYGLEVLDGGRRVDSPEVAVWRPVVDEVARRAAAALDDAVGVEHKGVSLTLHFRTAPDREAAVGAFAAAEGARTGLLVRPAKASIELHPPVAVDKGTALLAAAGGLDAVAFLGDDVGDLPAFAALGELAGRGVHVLRVGVVTSEAPPGLADAVDVVVDGPEGALAVLERLAG